MSSKTLQTIRLRYDWLDTHSIWRMRYQILNGRANNNDVEIGHLELHYRPMLLATAAPNKIDYKKNDDAHFDEA